MRLKTPPPLVTMDPAPTGSEKDISMVTVRNRRANFAAWSIPCFGKMPVLSLMVNLHNAPIQPLIPFSKKWRKRVHYPRWAVQLFFIPCVVMGFNMSGKSNHGMLCSKKIYQLPISERITSEKFGNFEIMGDQFGTLMNLMSQWTTAFLSDGWTAAFKVTETRKPKGWRREYLPLHQKGRGSFYWTLEETGEWYQGHEKCRGLDQRVKHL